jgi:Domain of unknown function (DUF1707)
MADVSGNRTPGDHGHLRAAHADRERAIDLLKTAFVRGMLDKAEFDLRVGQAFASRTYAELAAVTRDLPAPLPDPAVPVPAVPDEGWLTLQRAVAISACLLVPTALATALGAPFADRYDNTAFIVLPFLALFLASLISVPLITEALHRRRSQPRRPQAPAGGAGGKAVKKSQPTRRSPGHRDFTLAARA